MDSLGLIHLMDSSRYLAIIYNNETYSKEYLVIFDWIKDKSERESS